MTPDIIANCPLSDLPGMFPDKSPAEIRRLRKWAKNALWQREYRKQGRDTSNRNSYLGHLDGPPIARCLGEEKMRADAMLGSQALLDAIKAAGLSA